MKELIKLVKAFDWKGLFFLPTNNSVLQFFRYAFVGGIASIVDWGVLYFLTISGHHYLFGSIFGFFAGLSTNFCLSKQLVFKGAEVKINLISEIFAYAAIGAAGLAITILLMYILTDMLKVYFMISKAGTTLIVLIWNYTARKVSLYKG